MESQIVKIKDEQKFRETLSLWTSEKLASFSNKSFKIKYIAVEILVDRIEKMKYDELLSMCKITENKNLKFKIIDRLAKLTVNTDKVVPREELDDMCYMHYVLERVRVNLTSTRDELDTEILLSLMCGMGELYVSYMTDHIQNERHFVEFCNYNVRSMGKAGLSDIICAIDDDMYFELDKMGIILKNISADTLNYFIKHEHVYHKTMNKIDRYLWDILGEDGVNQYECMIERDYPRPDLSKAVVMYIKKEHPELLKVYSRLKVAVEGNV